MARSPNTTAESARASIDRDIEVHLTAVTAHLAAVLVLKQQRNHLQPISSLPPEIMYTIFSFVKSASPRELKWTEVSHVCKYWREVAVNAPGLWCNPPLGNPSWMEEMLARSKQVDISIDTVVTRNFLPDSFEKVFQHGARIRRISLNFEYGLGWVPRALASLPTSAPRLETLLISGPGYDTQAISIPKLGTLFDVPNLRRLELSRCEVNWASPWLPQITHLKICHIPNVDGLTWTGVMAALGKIHNLESLVLCHSLPLGSPSTSESDQLRSTNIHFSRLRMLSLDATAWQVEPFFRYITFSPGAAVRVRCNQNILQRPRTDAAHLATILTHIARSYSNPTSSDLPFKTLVVKQSGNQTGNIHFGLFNDILGESAEFFGDIKSPHCGLSFSFLAPRTSSASWFNTVFPGLFSVGFALDYISHVHLGSRKPLEEGILGLLVETVGPLPAVSFVKVSGLIGPCIVLESMHFHGVPFLPSYTTPTTRLGRVDRELLQQFLMMHSATVRRIRLEGCFSLKKADVDELCKVVGDTVCWDGVELDSSDYRP